MLEKEKLKAFIEAFEKCSNSKTTTTFEQFQFDYVSGPSPLPSFMNEEIEKFLQNEAYIILSKKPTNYLEKKSVDINEEEVIINVDKKFQNVSLNDENKNDFSADCFDESILPPNIQTFHGGSPMKLYDYQNDIKLNESVVKSTERYLPLDRFDAISFISCYNCELSKHIKSNNLKPLRLWILTKLSGRHRYVFMSSLLTYNIEGETKSTSINSLDVTYKKFFYSNSEDAYPIKPMFSLALLNAKNLKFNHKSSYVLHKSRAIRKELDQKTTDIFENTPQSNTVDNKDIAYNEIKILLDWSEESGILECPSLEANAELVVNIWDGTVNPQMVMLYEELCILKKFVKGLTDGKFQWNMGEGSKNKKDLIQEVIQENCLIGKNKVLNDKLLQKDFGATESGGTFDEKHCREYDLIDKIWNILKHSSSYEDLVEGFKVLFDAMEDPSFKPTINSNNKSILAQMFQENLSLRREVRSWLKDDRPVVMLFEIGLEKLKLDYIAYFVKLNLINSGQLLTYFGEVFENHEAKLLKLFRIHRVLEVNFFLSGHSSLSNSDILTFLKHIMQMTDITNCVQLSVPFSSVYHLIDNLNPFDWQCVVSGEKGNDDDMNDDILSTDDDTNDNDIEANDQDTNKEKVFNFFHFSTVPVFDEVDNEEDENVLGKSRYYVTSLHQEIYEQPSIGPDDFKFIDQF